MSATPNSRGGPPSGDTEEVADLDPRIARSRQRLLAAATDLLVEAGPRAVTVDAVSERSGVAKSTLYRHWDSRQALLVDVMRSNMPQPVEPDPSLGFEAALRALVTSVATTLSDPEWARIFPAMVSLRLTMPELQELSDSDNEGKLAVLSRVLRLGVDEGALPADIDARLVAHVLIGPVVFATISGQHVDLTAVAAFSVERFLQSYRSP
jgi:AcrR family transcriptional regulator